MATLATAPFIMSTLFLFGESDVKTPITLSLFGELDANTGMAEDRGGESGGRTDVMAGRAGKPLGPGIRRVGLCASGGLDGSGRAEVGVVGRATLGDRTSGLAGRPGTVDSTPFCQGSAGRRLSLLVFSSESKTRALAGVSTSSTLVPKVRLAADSC